MHPVISVEDLAAELETRASAEAADPADLVLLDVRWRLGGPSTRPEYDAGHLPGAAFVDLETELAAPPGKRGRHPLPDQRVFEQAMQRAGVNRHSRVVCYDLADSTAAARAWWLLRWFGHHGVAVLDGGYASWLAAGLPVDTRTPTPQSGEFSARPGGMLLVDSDEAARIAREGVLLDARAEVRYAAEQEPIDPVAGHVPGALSAPTTDNVGADGRFLTADQLRARFARWVRPGRPVATYCGSGVTAAHQVLALEIAGVTAGLYADSWSGWITDRDRPVAVGRDPG